MSRLMDIGLKKLESLIHNMSRLSEECINMAIESYIKDKDSSKDLYERSSKMLILYHEVRELVTELLIRYQPLAGDLRYIRGCLEISYDLFRSSRYAYDITLVRNQIGELSHCDHSLIINTANEVKKMLYKSIDAFIKRDVELAKVVRDDDDLIDNLYKENLRRILNEKIDIKCAIASVLIMRYLERIADHAVYISDLVRYIVEGEIVYK